jgi:hypothetical protein
VGVRLGCWFVFRHTFLVVFEKKKDGNIVFFGKCRRGKVGKICLLENKRG